MHAFFLLAFSNAKKINRHRPPSSASSILVRYVLYRTDFDHFGYNVSTWHRSCGGAWEEEKKSRESAAAENAVQDQVANAAAAGPSKENRKEQNKKTHKRHAKSHK